MKKHPQIRHKNSVYLCLQVANNDLAYPRKMIKEEQEKDDYNYLIHSHIHTIN